MIDAKVGRYTLEKDIEDLRAAKCMIVATSILPGYGYLIFWYDKQGYSVTERRGGARGEKSSSVSGALPYKEGLDHYLESIEALADERYH